MPLKELRHRKLLAVEGRGPKVFFEHYLHRLEIADVQVEDFGGTSMFRPFIKAATLLPGFMERVVSFAVIRDALRAAGLAVPSAPDVAAGDRPKVHAFILPGGGQEEMIETLCLQSVEADPCMPCVEEFFQCAENSGHTLPSNLTKARTHAFLATRPKPDLPMWTAAQKDYWNWSHAAFEPLTAFLQRL